jgi:hypothetical protein
MTKPRKSAPRDDWAAYEDACNMIFDLGRRLQAGTKRSGVTLTADECDLVFRNLKTPPPPPHRNAMTWSEKQQAMAPIFRHCRELEKSKGLKSAVIDTAKHFDCSTSKVYAALRAIRAPYK